MILLTFASLLLKNKAMAIFGKAVMLNGSETTLLREGNDWDVFLNYYFAIFFILCFTAGIVLNPFIIVYHAKQEKTFAKFMFLLVSSIDQFKLVCFPLMLVPKLLSPLEDKDYYIIYNPTSVPWTSYPTFYLNFLVWFEMEVLVILSISRYVSIAHSMLSSRKRDFVSFAAVVISFLKWVIGPIIVRMSQRILFYSRISDSFGYTIYEDAFGYLMGSSTTLLAAIGAIFVALTIHYLKNRDTASSEISGQNIKKGIISLLVINAMNVFVLFSIASVVVAIHLKLFTDYSAKSKTYSTSLDFFKFGVLFGTPMAQSFFNCLSFLFISRQFRDFLKGIFKR